MNQESTQSRSALTKTFAVIGFVILVLIVGWLAVRIVTLIPGAFSSLASLADSIHNPDPEVPSLTLTTEDSVVNSQESFTISWTDIEQEGAYSLSYNCVDGVSLDIRTKDSSIITLNCGAPYQFTDNTYAVDAVFSSEKERFSDVSYSIAFMSEDDSQTKIETNKTLTVVNPSIPEGIVAGIDTDSEDITILSDGTEPETPMTDVDPAPVTIPEEPAYTPPLQPHTPPQPEYRFTQTLQVPQSNPNGFTELAVEYGGIGVLKNGKFALAGSLDPDEQGAFQFTVKNTGTKTSTDWNFVATFTSGATFESKDQDPIKPNETVTVTVAFRSIGDDGVQRFGAEIDGGNDRSSSNNSFTWAVRVGDADDDASGNIQFVSE